MDLLGFDLGAESGRLVVGRLQKRQLLFDEVSRFAIEPVAVSGVLYWNILDLYKRMLECLGKYQAGERQALAGIGIASWSNDFGLLADDGHLLCNPVHYRDRRTLGMVAKLQERISLDAVHRTTGMALAPTQTVCQLLSMRLQEDARLECARTFLMIPDLLTFFLTGEKACEQTNAVNTQLYNARAGSWWKEMLDVLELPDSIMPPVLPPGTEVGRLVGDAARDVGLEHIPVYASCTHDTASAVAAVPAVGSEWAFISSGTWSVVGTMAPQMIPEACPLGLCNELTLEGTFICRNIKGLWLLQRARRAFASLGRTYSYADLAALAANESSGEAIVNVDDPIFMAPEDMLDAIRQFCRSHGQCVPDTPGVVVRCILESLALSYRHALEQISKLTGKKFQTIHVVGGGSSNALLCQMTADATRTTVMAGPKEATAIGNLLTVAVGRGLLGNAADIREVVRNSCNTVEYTPSSIRHWDDLYGRYMSLLERP